ncbi:sporulation-delaying protein SdpB family protein [Streptomyces sp. DSM 41269]|uniref:sporulation-delaying protein SdpB family protein n=1 Tax=Streptomyces sp. DSM 41269 TaxID=2817709 RepID=UPI000998548C|nr:sporulation-delaying protein SdpB family protein [Streptomyces sp. DSM 41269]
MLTARLGAFASGVSSVSPWTNVYGVARTLIAFGTLSTLLATGTESLFLPAQGVPDYPKCEGPAAIGIYCVMPGANLGLARLLSILVLLVVASGWRPRYTAIPHWWVTFSFQANVTAPDGGDQIAAVMALLMIPIALGDGRTWHWGTAPHRGTPQGRSRGWSLFAWSASVVIRVQVAGLYFQSSVAKLSHTEWADGTSLFYWLRDPYFGAPAWISPLTDAITRTSFGVIALTWGPLVIEFAMVLGLFAKRSVRPYLLAAGVSLHFFIGLLMGLGSFAFAMFGCLVLLLRPLDEPFGWVDRLAGRWRSTALGQKLAAVPEDVRTRAGTGPDDTGPDDTEAETPEKRPVPAVRSGPARPATDLAKG